MDFVEIQRLAAQRAAAPVVHPLPVRPWITVQIVELGGRIGAGLRVERVGISLELYLAVGGLNGILIVFIGGEAGDPDLPDAVPHECHGMGAHSPAVEGADHGHRSRAGRPDAKKPAGFTTLLDRMRAKPGIRTVRDTAQKIGDIAVRFCAGGAFHGHLLHFETISLAIEPKKWFVVTIC